MSIIRGRVKRYYDDKKFGFIAGSDGKDVFVHFSHINVTGYKKLIDGQMVDYEVVQGNKGLEARNVTVIEAPRPQAAHAQRNQAIEHDTEDKGYWVKKGAEIEK